MIPTDSATLRAKGLHSEAQKQNYPLRAFAGFYHGHGGLRLGVRTTRSCFVRTLPQVELQITTTMDAEHLQQMIEDAWLGLRRDYDIKRNAPLRIPESRHSWRSQIATDSRNAKARKA